MGFDPRPVQRAYEAMAGGYEARFADDLDENELDRAVVDAAIEAAPDHGIVLDEIRRVLRPGGAAVIATHVGHGEEMVEASHEDRSEAVLVTYYAADELAALAEVHRLIPTDLRERPPLPHEHQVRKLYLTAVAS